MSNKDLSHLTLSVGYTDALVPLTAWPLTTVAWTLTPRQGQGADLDVHLALQPGGLTPAAEAAGDAAVSGARETAARFAAVWYQIQQPDVTMSLSTSLQQSGDTPDVLAIKMDQARAFMTGAYQFARDAAAVRAACADPAVTATLADVVSHYGVNWQALGLAAGDRFVGNLIDLKETPFSIPCYTVAYDGASPNDLFVGVSSVPDLMLDADNADLPLQVGTELVVPAVVRPQPDDGLPLNLLAERYGLSVASLVRANQASTGLLRPGFVFTAQGVAVAVPDPADGGNAPGPPPSLDDIAATFAANGVPYDAVMVAGANAEQPGMFADRVKLVVDRRIIKDGWTLNNNGCEASSAELASANAGTVDLYPPGTPLLLKMVQRGADQVAKEPLGALARANGIEAGDLLRHNAGVAVRAAGGGEGLAATGFPIPGMCALPAAWDENPPARLPSEGSGYSPAQLGTLTERDPTSMLSANQATPNLILAGAVLKPTPLLSQPTLTTAAADSINSILARFNAAGVAVTVADLVQANLNNAFLAPGAALLLPPAETVLRVPIGVRGWRFPGSIFPLRTWVTLSRNADLVEADFKGTDVAAITSPIAIQRESNPAGAEDDAETLDAFIAALAKALPGLVPATGQVVKARENDGPSDLFGVSFLAGQGIWMVAITPPAPAVGDQGPQPYSFALRPLFNSVQSADAVAVAPYDPDSGGLGTPQQHDYQGVNVEDWAHAWLAGLDLLCTGPYVTAAYPINPAAMGRLLAAKQGLADAVADGLSAVLADQNAAGASVGSVPWKAAREVLRQRLLGDLVRAYDGTAMIQWQVAVGALPDVANARLSGAGSLADDGDDGDRARLGNAKLDLANTKEGTLTFPFNLSRPGTDTAITLNPTYAVKEIEYHIEPVVAGYARSEWLQFTGSFAKNPPPAYTAELGTPLIPVPLRSYPAQPALAFQEALTNPAAATPDEACYWAYRVAVAHEAAAGDQLVIAVECNRGAGVGQEPGQNNDDLFAALAQYAAIEDALWATLDSLTPSGSDGDPTTLAAALTTYADLAEKVTAAWSAHWNIHGVEPRLADVGQIHPRRRNPKQDQSKTVQHIINSYAASFSLGDNGLIRAVSLTQLDKDNTLGWPDISLVLEGDIHIPLTGTDPLRSTRDYVLPKKAPAPITAARRLELTFPKLHIAEIQNITTAVSVQRNLRLLGHDGPRTCSSLIYRTPESAFPQPLVPLIVVSEPMVMKPWSEIQNQNPPAHLLGTLTRDRITGRDIGFAVRYAYTLAEADPPLKTFLPVALRPRTTADDQTVDAVVAALKKWQKENNPIQNGGEWTFDFSFYSTVDPKRRRPLLQLKQWVFPVG
ncbi:hypothetical protein [Acanthopleuribacter pedis]|uniref:LysM domain-containing protein n=1 Tax=Acanthopleuribacter pedis TaxID=442870 RepID=A0A8J7QE12_9BACT|nr:hypothetical protein [Acanthopleuribacter pedis]MBO1321375.1 hypothetical protein [Acanthopleuribacter pedis]